jgi:hypothetical protein
MEKKLTKHKLDQIIARGRPVTLRTYLDAPFKAQIVGYNRRFIFTQGGDTFCRSDVLLVSESLESNN